MKYIFILLLLAPFASMSQSMKKDKFAPIKPFLGEWAGKSEGQVGKGDCFTAFKPTLKGQFIEVKNTAVYPKTEQKPNGEIHEDIGYISYDATREKLVLRQFHVEGFINQYYLDSISEDGKTLVFITEQLENIPAGWRAKETFQLVSEKEFIETFELAEPGKDFFMYSKIVFKRQ